MASLKIAAQKTIAGKFTQAAPAIATPPSAEALSFHPPESRSGINSASFGSCEY
jgi:hypothetical protein